MTGAIICVRSPPPIVATCPCKSVLDTGDLNLGRIDNVPNAQAVSVIINKRTIKIGMLLMYSSFETDRYTIA
jgi:hypothetical protein